VAQLTPASGLTTAAEPVFRPASGCYAACMPTTELTRFQEAEEALSVPLARYVGRWVAVRDHNVIADAATPAELLERVQGQKYEAMFQVPEHSEGGCFF
jgi:hypothetical protein